MPPSAGGKCRNSLPPSPTLGFCRCVACSSFNECDFEFVNVDVDFEFDGINFELDFWFCVFSAVHSALLSADEWHRLNVSYHSADADSFRGTSPAYRKPLNIWTWGRAFQTKPPTRGRGKLTGLPLPRLRFAEMSRISATTHHARGLVICRVQLQLHLRLRHRPRHRRHRRRCQHPHNIRCARFGNGQRCSRQQ